MRKAMGLFKLKLGSPTHACMHLSAKIPPKGRGIVKAIRAFYRKYPHSSPKQCAEVLGLDYEYYRNTISVVKSRLLRDLGTRNLALRFLVHAMHACMHSYRFSKAWQTLKENRVKKYVFKPSGRVLWIVVGRDREEATSDTVSERVQNGVQELVSTSTWNVVNRLLWMFTMGLYYVLTACLSNTIVLTAS